MITTKNAEHFSKIVEVELSCLGDLFFGGGGGSQLFTSYSWIVTIIMCSF